MSTANLLINNKEAEQIMYNSAASNVPSADMFAVVSPKMEQEDRMESQYSITGSAFVHKDVVGRHPFGLG